MYRSSRFSTAHRRAMPRAMASNVVPPWVLPFLRLVRGRAQGDMATAWALLGAHLPPGVTLPDVRDAASVLVALRLVG